jgi:hypothetical protein
MAGAGAAAGGGYWNPAGVAGGFGAPHIIGSATPRNFISRTLGFAERPSALIIRSDDGAFGVSETDTVAPSRFDVVLKQPILEVKAMALRSATFRNLIPNVPNYQRYFYYQVNGRRFVFKYGQYSETGSLEVARELTDFIVYLNESAAYVVEVPAGFCMTNDYYVSNVRNINNPADPLYPYLLQFAASSTTGRIGCALNPIVGLPADECAIGGLVNVPLIFAATAYVRPDLTLNSLVGVPSTPSAPIVFQRSAGAQTFLEPPNLLGSQSIYVTINITSSGETTAAHNTASILGYLSTGNVPKGGIINYAAPFPHWIWQVAPAIQELVVTLLDENLQPFELPFNCLVELEVAFLYSDSSL